MSLPFHSNFAGSCIQARTRLGNGLHASGAGDAGKSRRGGFERDLVADGDLDAFIGNSDGNIFFFRNAEPAAWDGSSWGGVTPGPGTDVLILGGYDSQEQGGFDCSNLRVGQEGLLLIGTGGTIRVGGQ